MKNSKSTVVLKSGKTKSPSAALDKQRFTALKQGIKDAKLHLQGIKRALRDAKDAVKRAKLEYKNAWKSAVKKATKQTDKKAVKAKPVVLSRPASSKPAAVKKTAARKSAAKPAGNVVASSKPVQPVRTAKVLTKPKPMVRKRSARSIASAAGDVSADAPVLTSPAPTAT